MKNNDQIFLDRGYVRSRRQPRSFLSLTSNNSLMLPSAIGSFESSLLKHSNISHRDKREREEGVYKEYMRNRLEHVTFQTSNSKLYKIVCQQLCHSSSHQHGKCGGTLAMDIKIMIKAHNQFIPSTKPSPYSEIVLLEHHACPGFWLRTQSNNLVHLAGA